MDTRVVYCGLGVADVSAFDRFLTKGLGLVGKNSGDVQKYRLDERSWRFSVREAPDNDILFLGLELNDAGALKRKRENIEKAGISCQDLSAIEIADREIGSGFWLTDADGLRIEFVAGQSLASEPFKSPTVTSFKTGDQGLGHVVLSTGDLDKGVGFYEALGFRLSDFIVAEIQPGVQLRIAFMHCNSRHHSLALAALPQSGRLNHIMIEADEVDDMIQAHRRCGEMGFRPGNIGRHPNDRMLSFYVPSPAGFDIEYGWGGRSVGEDWKVGEYSEISLWGHEPAA